MCAAGAPERYCPDAREPGCLQPFHENGRSVVLRRARPLKEEAERRRHEALPAARVLEHVHDHEMTVGGEAIEHSAEDRAVVLVREVVGYVEVEDEVAVAAEIGAAHVALDELDPRREAFLLDDLAADLGGLAELEDRRAQLGVAFTEGDREAAVAAGD